jgi:ABC-type transport system involved in multi-copper enzyme maturation permease subunit
VVRAAYVGLLWVLGLTAWQQTVGWTQTATLGDNAQFGSLLFHFFTKWVQLPLLLFFSALSAVSAISQEKDRRTFVLLLLTDLRSYEIVLGKLLGSLLEIGLLLVGIIPALALIVLLGGVAPFQVAQAGLVFAATALAAGSVGTLIALWREKTFQSLALTVLLLVLYLCLVGSMGRLPSLIGWLVGGDLSSWQALVNTAQGWLDPFTALENVLEPSVEQSLALPPALGFAGTMLVLSLLLNAWGIIRLRVWNPSGEPVIERESPEAEEKDRALAHAAPGQAREVWANPILWREIRTRAYGRRPLIVKLAFALVLALVCYYALGPVFLPEMGRVESPIARGLVPVGILSLLLVSAQAVTAITSERDGGALDLLLVTDLSPQEFIFGKVLGILYNTKEYLLPPFILAGIYAWLGLLATPRAQHPEMLGYKNGEALVFVLGAMFVLGAFAIVLGLHVALRNASSRLGVFNTLATMFFLSVGTGLCIFLIRINSRFEVQWFSFILFIAAGIGGLWWVLSADRPSGALTVASWACPIAVFYTVVNILVAKPGAPEETTDPLIPFLTLGGAFGFTVAAMLVPLLSEFDVALGRTTGGGE